MNIMKIGLNRMKNSKFLAILKENNLHKTKLPYCNRAILQKTTKLKNLNFSYDDYNAHEDWYGNYGDLDHFDDYLTSGGSDKYSKAKHVVHGMTLTNTLTAAMAAQIPIADKAALTAVEVAMGMKIMDIYGFKFQETYKESLLMAARATVVGTLASSVFTWIPIIGNIANAVIGGYTTKAFGDALIDKCEKIQEALDRGKKIDDILKGL